MTKKELIPLFYWSSKKIEKKNNENYGDLLSKYLVEKISGKEVIWRYPKKKKFWKKNPKVYLAIGSIISHASKNSIVWGSGIIDIKYDIAKADFRAVRGPQTRKFIKSLGYNCPEVYGDPALLLPKYYKPEVPKRHEVGIIPHYVDYPFVNKLYKNNKDIKVIDLLTDNIERTTDEILSCENIISSSLHGVILSHAYKIPAVWVKFSDKVSGNNIKYKDYFESVGIKPYDAEYISEKESVESFLNLIENTENAIPNGKLDKVQKDLLDSCPFIDNINE